MMTDGIGIDFIKKTKHKNLSETMQAGGHPQPPLELPHENSSEVVKLPDVSELSQFPIDLKIAIENRRTLRTYQPDPLTLDEMSFLLWLSQGVTKKVENKYTRRTIPSAGSRHAFETYLLINRVEGLKSGLYRYLALQHALLPIDFDEEINQKLTTACSNQHHVATSAVTFIWIAVRDRMIWRYGERGYRYLFLDAGHVCQNLYLGAEAIGCGVCAVASFDDDKLNQALKIDGENLFAIYLGTVGKKQIGAG